MNLSRHLAAWRKFWVEEPVSDPVECARRDAIMAAEHAAGERIARPMALAFVMVCAALIVVPACCELLT